jgi:hypothetical protein
MISPEKPERIEGLFQTAVHFVPIFFGELVDGAGIESAGTCHRRFDGQLVALLFVKGPVQAPIQTVTHSGIVVHTN